MPSVESGSRLERLHRFFYTGSRFKLLAALWGLMIIRTGLWYMPNLDLSRRVALSPFANEMAEPAGEYLFWNWFGPLIAFLLHATGKIPFLLLHLCFSVVFTLVMLRALFANLEERQARTSALLFFVLPASATSYYWIGMDSLTLLLMALALLAERPVFCGLIGLMLGMQHFEQSFIAYAILIVGLLLCRKYDPEFAPVRKWVAVLAGIVLGRILLALILEHFSITLHTGRIALAFLTASNLSLKSLLRLHFVLWSFFGAGWLVAVRHFSQGKSAIPFWAGTCAAVLVAMLVFDQTRVFAIVSFPLLSVFWLMNRRLVDTLSDSRVVWILLLWLLTPWFFVWNGTPRGSAFVFDILYAMNRLFGWFQVPADPTLWPFQSTWP